MATYRRAHAAALAAVLLATVCAFGAPRALAQSTVTWTGGGADGNWETGGNWSTGSEPTNGDTLDFSGTTQTTSTNTIASGSFGGLLFSNDGEANRDGQFALSGNLFTLSGPITTTAATTGTLLDTVANDIALASTTTVTTGLNHDLTLSGSISGAGSGITKNGGGLLTLSGTNSFTGPIAINGGTFEIGGAGTLDGNYAGTIAIAEGARLLFSSSVNQNLTGVISGSGGIEKTGDAILILSAANTFTGPITVNSGQLRGNAANSLGAVGTVTTVNAGQVDLRNANAATSRGITYADTATLFLTNNSTTTFAVGNVTQQSGTLTITGRRGGTSTNTPTHTLNTGTLSLAGSLVLNTGPGTTLVIPLQGQNQTIDGFSSTGSGTAVLTNNSATNVTFTVGSQGGGGVFAGQIRDTTTTTTGTLALVKTGAGTISLSGSNDYTGGTQVNAGTLVYSTTASRPALGTTTVAATATLGLGVGDAPGFFTTADVDALFSGTLAGVSMASGAGVAIDTTAGNFTYATSQSAARGLTKLGNNTLTLTGANTYSGGTTIAEGTLQLGDGTTNGSITGNVVNNTALVFNPGSASPSTFGGSITGPGTLSKVGTGTLVFTGTSAATGTVSVAGGRLLLDGSVSSGDSNTTIANASGQSGFVYVGESGSLSANALNIGANVGSSTGVGSLVVAGGTVSTTNTGGTGLNLGANNANTGYGGVFVLSGSVQSRRVDLWSTSGSSAGVVRIDGGTLSLSEWMIIRNGNFEVTVTSGTLDRALASSNLALAHSNSGVGSLNVTGGLVDNTGRDITVRQSAGTGTASINLNAGRVITNSILVNNPEGTGWLNFNGGTLQPGSNDGTLVASSMTAAYVNGGFGSFAGGAVIDTAGLNTTIAANLLTPSGTGVSGLALTGSGSGYIGAPLVKITGGGGTGATGYATVDLDPASPTFGQLTGVVLTNPGVNYTSTPTVELIGGGGSGAAISVAGLAPNTSGGLTKLGNGTLALTGENTYTGVTDVRGGTLSATPLALATSSAIRVGVDGNAAFDLFAASVPAELTMATNADFTLGGATSGGSLSLRLGADTASSDRLVLGGSGVFSVGEGGGVINAIAESGFAGGTYTLVSGPNAIGGAANLAFGLLPGGYTYAFDTDTTGELKLVATAAAAADLYWRGPSGGVWSNFGAVGTNWATDSGGATGASFTPGADTTAYVAASNVPAEPLTMDLGGPVSVAGLRVNASPATAVTLAAEESLTVGSGGIAVEAEAPATTIAAPVVLGANQTWSVADAGTTLDVSGVVSGAANLTKSGAGTVALSAANTFTGTTTLDGGRLRLTANANGVLGIGTAALVATSGTLEIASDANRNLARPTTVDGNVTISTQRLTAGAGVTHTLGTLEIAGQTLTIDGEGSATSGNQGVTFGAVTLSGNPTFTVNNNTDGAATVLTLGAISGENLGFTKNGNGTLLLNNNSTFTGTLTLQAGTLRNTTGGVNGLGQGSLTLAGGRLELANNTGRISARPTTVTGDVTISTERIAIGAGLTHTLGTLAIGGQTLTVSGTNANSGTQGLTFGAVTLSGNPTFTVNNNTDGAATRLTLGAVTNNGHTMTFNGSGDVTPGIIAGTGGVTRGGTGLLTMNVAHEFTGPLTINSGTVLVSTTTAALGQGTLTLAGGTLDFADNSSRAYGRDTSVSQNSTIITRRTSAGNGVTATLGALAIGGQMLTIDGQGPANNLNQGVTFGAVTLSGNPTFTVNNNTDGAATVLTLGAITGANLGFTKNGNGTLILTGNSQNMTGTVTLDGGILRATVNSNNAFGGGAATLTLQSGTLQIAQANVRNYNRQTTVTGNVTIQTDRNNVGAGVTHTIGSLSIGNHTLTATSGILPNEGTQGLTFGATTLTGNPTFDVVNGSVPTVLTLGALGGDDRGLTKSGNGTLVLSASSSATNLAVTLSGGRLEATNSSALGSNATLNVAAAATFAAVGTSPQLAGLTGSGTVEVTSPLNRLTVSIGSGSQEFGGVITGPGRFAKAGAGTLVLSAASDFTGDTEIQAGTLVLGNSGSIAASRGVFLSSPTAQLDATPAGGLVIGAVKGVGGVGTITGGLTLASGAVLVVDRDAVVGGLPLTVSGTVSLPDTFSLTSLFGLNGEVLDLSLFPEGRFTLIANASDFSNIGDWGPTKKVDIGDGRSAYFDTGSLVLVVVPEPGAVVIAAVGLAGLAWRVRRRARRSCEQDWDATLFLIES